MANANLPRGLVPVRYQSGAPYNGAMNIAYVPSTYATALYRGDPLIWVTDASDAIGIPVVARATAAGGNYISGVCAGPLSGGDPAVPVLATDPQYHVASTGGYVGIITDPYILWEIQEDSVGGVMTVGAAGRNADLIAGSGSTVSGWSGFQLDSSTLNTTNTLQLRIRETVQRVDNDATLDYAKWLVQINLHSARNLTGT